MKLQPSKFFLLVVVTAAFVCIGIAHYHYRVDRWGVFASDYRSFHEKIIVNKLFLKSRFLLETEHSYDCFLFGSSRLAAIDAGHFGETCYNFTHSGGVVPDHVSAVKLLLDNGVPVERVYIALDDLSYNENAEEGIYQHMRRAYPANFNEFVGFNRLFLLQPPDFTDLALYSGKRPKLDTPRYIVDPNLDTERIRLRYQKFFDEPGENDVRFRRLQGMGEGDVYYGDTSVAAIKQLQALAAEHDIALELFFLPLHYKTYLKRNYPWFTRFKRDMASLQPFLDFSGLHRYSVDNRYWRETSHFSAVVGDAMASELNSNESGAVKIGRLFSAAQAQSSEEDQVALDAVYLPLLAQREGVLSIPERFVNLWRENSALKTANISVLSSPDRRFLNPLDVTPLRFAREDDGESRTALVSLDVQRGDFFVLNYDFSSKYPEVMTWRLSHDKAEYEGSQKMFKLRVLPGENKGSYLGYASVDRPQLRLNMGGGNLAYDWQGLSLQRLELDAPEKRTMEEFAQLY